MAELLKKLKEYSNSGVYPFHMPGHKRAISGDVLPYDIDITEIDGFDNLNILEEGGILWQMTEDATSLYGAYGANVAFSSLLVNGSTGGIMAAIRAAVPHDSGIVIARNCHKSVYQAAESFNLDVRYVYPSYIKEYGIFSDMDIDELSSVLREARQEVKASALVVTSPTYEGVILDIKAIAEVAHKYNMALIVDEAHGAHLPYVDESITAINNGADIVIQSLHKTLPSMTQTAIIHLTNEGKNRSVNLAKRLRETIPQFQTTSPSYVLMASMDECFNMCKKFKAEGRFDKYLNLIRRYREEFRGLKNLKLLDGEGVSAFAYDEGKIVFLTAGTDVDGFEVMRRFRDKGIECEMAAESYVVLMTSVMDSEEGFKRLKEAVFEIDGEVNRVSEIVVTKPVVAKKEKVKLRLACEENMIKNQGDKNQGDGSCGSISQESHNNDQGERPRGLRGLVIPEQAMNILDARERDSVAVSFDKIKKQLEVGVLETSAMMGNVTTFVAGEYVMMYPPGVPILVPGEKITLKVLELIEGVVDEVKVLM